MPYYRTLKTAAGAINLNIDDVENYVTVNVKRIGNLIVGFDNSGSGEDIETIFFPSNFEITFQDPGATMYYMLLANSALLTLTGALSYTGLTDPMLTTRDEKSKETTIIATDKSNVLKTISIKDNSGNSLKPLGYTQGNEYDLGTLLANVFAKVNSGGVNLTISQDWMFKEMSGYGNNLYNFSQVYANIDPLFFSNMPYGTLRDLLSGLALTFGCMVGMTDYGHACFVKRWKPASSSISLVGRIKQIKGANRYDKLTGVRVVQNSPLVSPSSYDEPTSGFVFSDDKTLLINLWLGCSNTDSNLAGSYDGVASSPIGTVQDLAIDGTFREIRQTIAKYHYAYRSVYRQKYEITLYGLKDINGDNYSMLNQYSNGSMILRPSQIKLDAQANEATMIALDVTDA